MFNDLINSHLAVTLGVSGSNVDGSSVHLLLTSNKDVIPLCKLCVSDFLVNLTLRTVNRGLESILVKVLVY